MPRTSARWPPPLFLDPRPFIAAGPCMRITSLSCSIVVLLLLLQLCLAPCVAHDPPWCSLRASARPAAAAVGQRRLFPASLATPSLPPTACLIKPLLMHNDRRTRVNRGRLARRESRGRGERRVLHAARRRQRAGQRGGGSTHEAAPLIDRSICWSSRHRRTACTGTGLERELRFEPAKLTASSTHSAGGSPASPGEPGRRLGCAPGRAACSARLHVSPLPVRPLSAAATHRHAQRSKSCLPGSACASWRHPPPLNRPLPPPPLHPPAALPAAPPAGGSR